MSRVGKKPIPVPNGVKVTVNVDSVDVEGPKGKLQQMFPSVVRFELSDGQLHAQLVNEGDKSLRKFHGLARSLVANAVHGVSEGFKKELDIVGIGYRAEVKVLFEDGARGGNKAGARVIGKAVAERLIKQGVKQVVFDRGGFLYHGRVRSVAEAAREAGLEF